MSKSAVLNVSITENKQELEQLDDNRFSSGTRDQWSIKIVLAAIAQILIRWFRPKSQQSSVQNDASDNIVRPVKILRALSTSEGCLPLTLKTCASACEVILDYGRCEGGIPVFDIISCSSAENTAVEFDVVYSEGIEAIDHEDGDGPFFLFSNAMNTYRRESYKIKSSGRITAQLAQQSQRYQKIILKTPNSSITFSNIGFTQLRQPEQRVCSFKTSDPVLNAIYETGVRTVDLCTVAAGETLEAWQATNQGTRVTGQHWAPCRQGTRWTDKHVTFEVLIETLGASWAVHMVANGLIFCLDAEQRQLRAYEGLSHQNGVFPSLDRGSWQIPEAIDLHGWLTVETNAIGSDVAVRINDIKICTVNDLNMHPLLGGAPNNSGSIAFGGPSGYSSIYRNLHVITPSGKALYQNNLQQSDLQRTLADFQTGTNAHAATMDGAKRDRAVFGGDLYVMGRSIYFSTGRIEAVLGSIRLLTSHQTADGYLGNLCPLQAPRHDDVNEETPTYGFYSLSYALLLVVAVKDYYMHTADRSVVEEIWPKLTNLMEFVKRFVNERGIVVAPPPVSMDWLPLGGPIFGASGKINIAYYEALNAMSTMTDDRSEASKYEAVASSLKTAIRTHLMDPETSLIRMSDTAPAHSIAQDVAAYGITTKLTPPQTTPISASSLDHPSALPAAYTSLPNWDRHAICSPYASGFEVESLFTSSQGHEAIKLMKRVWQPMTDKTSPNYSGAHWEAMSLTGGPFMHDMSFAHGWSTWPVFLLPMYLAGLRPLEVGWRRFAIAPVLAGVEKVDVGIVLPVGKVEVDLTADEIEGVGCLKVMIPLGAVAVMSAPVGWTLDCGNAVSRLEVVGTGHEVTVRMRRL